MSMRSPLRGRHGFRSWIWSDWTIGRCRLEYGTLTLAADGRAHFAGVTSTTDADGADHWSAGFSLETREGVRLHAEPARPGLAMSDGRPDARYRWSFDFTYEPSAFARIERVVQSAGR
jgi:hypothetical protein